MADAKAIYRVTFFRRICSLREIDIDEPEDFEKMEESSVARSGVLVEAIAKAGDEAVYLNGFKVVCYGIGTVP